MSDKNSDGTEEILEAIREREQEFDDGVAKTRITINSLSGKNYKITSTTPRRVIVQTLIKRLRENVPIVFPITSNDGTKTMDFIIPSTLVQDIGIEDYSNLDITQVVPKQRRIQS